MTTLIILALLIILAIIIISAGVKVVPQSETRVIERLGRFHSVLSPGLNFIIPFIDRPKMIYTRKSESSGGRNYVRTTTTKIIDLREQVYDFPSQQVITRDNVTTEINALLYFQITDPKKAVYEIDNLPNAIEKLTQTSLRNVIGELELDETLTSRDTINTKLQAILDDATNKWGVKVNRVELQDITPPESVRVAMEKQMQAERNRRAEILNAEGEKQSRILRSEGEKASRINEAEAHKQSQILKAEGEAEAIILNAKAEADAIRRVAEAVADNGMIPQNGMTGSDISKTDPAAYMLAMKYIEALRDMTAGKDNKVIYMPYEASSLLSSLGSIKTLFNGQ
ncbi:MAG: SPFH/Band 7/PHB domain protein [Muribaculaceae bacterium]|nr:SPFH/Band 7/PHB domain protein [Muribaculaceae bacterium]